MVMTRDEKVAYQRGYQRGLRRAWPDHIPPVPPCAAIAGIMKALTAMRNELDGQLAHMDPDDEWEHKFGPLIDQADEAFRVVSEWMRQEAGRID